MWRSFCTARQLDESGSMGIILPSFEAIYGALSGGVIGLLIGAFVCAWIYAREQAFVDRIFTDYVENRKKLSTIKQLHPRDLARRIMTVSIVYTGSCFYLGVWIGGTWDCAALSAALGGTTGLILGLVAMMRTRHE